MGRRIELGSRYHRTAEPRFHSAGAAESSPRGCERCGEHRILHRPADQRPRSLGRPFLRGFVITNAGTADNVKALVYVDGFIPDEGEFPFQILAGSGSALDVPDPTTVLDLIGYPGAPEGDLEAFLKPETVHSAFAPDLPESDRWLIAASQRPITLGANTTPSGPPAWKGRSVWAVIGTEDRIIPPAVQRSMAERAGATITEVVASHVSMVSHPEVAVAAILAAAAAVEE